MAECVLTVVLGIVFACFIIFFSIGSVWLMFEEDKEKHEEN